jgi:diguanylate cyclase (GGDEF)-like protein
MAGKAARRKIKRLAAITRAYLRIDRIPELDKISRIYLRELIDMGDCDGCAIILIDADKAKILAERGFSNIFKELEFNNDAPLIEYVVNTKQAIFTGDIQSNPAADYIPHGCPINSLICTPIMVNNDVRGIIHLDSLKKNAFNKKDMEFTELLSKEISIAFRQSFQYSQVRHTLAKDELTGCFNRRQFDADIVVEIASAEKHGEQLSLIVLDIDWFMNYNDLYGQPKGDTLLKKLADIVASNIRAYHKIYRYGGEEFAILMVDTDKDKALSVARRLQKTIEQEQFEGEKISQPNGKITVSIGIATFPSDADNSSKLTEAADLAVYRAKESGRNQVCVFSKEE